MALAGKKHNHMSRRRCKLSALGGFYGTLLLNILIIQAARGDYFTNTGSLSVAHQNPTATLLPSGRVLLVGGVNALGYSAVAELYDPNSGTWSLTGTLATGRTGHRATLLQNGKVLVAGGFNYFLGGALSSAELYDPALGTWTPAGSMTSPRTGATATLLPNGKVLVAGGVFDSNSDATNSADLYDPTSGTWSPTGAMATARDSHTATLLPNGKVIVVGGNYYSGGSVYLASVEIYDPALGTWSASGPLGGARTEHTTTLLATGKLLAAGGWGNQSITATAELYDTTSGTWTSTGAMTAARYLHTATLLSSGRVVVVGGLNLSSAADVYVTASGTWSATGIIGTPRYAHTATLLPNGNILIAGGSGNSGYLSSAELFVVTPSPSLPIVLTGATMMPGGAFRFGFTNTPGATFSAWSTTNVSLPLNNWTALGAVTEVSPGRFQFTDAQAATAPRQFYRVSSP